MHATTSLHMVFVDVKASITTSSNVLLDYPGYNKAQVMCVFYHDPRVSLDILITWTVSTDNSTASDVTDLSVQDGTSSTLDIMLSDVGTVVLTCESGLVYNNVTRELQYSNSSTIIVKGINLQ